MNWLWGLAGAFIGGLLSEDRGVMGVVFGFFILFVFGSLRGARRRVDALEAEVAKLRAVRLAAASGPLPAAEPAPAPLAEAAPEPVLAESAAPEPDVVESDVVAPTAASREPPPLPEARMAPESPVAPEPAAPREPAVPPEPDFAERLVGAVKRWFTEGNVPVKIGVLVLFAGVAAALRFAAAEGYFTFPIEWRLVTIAAFAVGGLGLGWRERRRRPAFGLSLQGGAIGVLLLTVFAAFRYYHLLPPGLAFGLVVVLVAGAALLAVLQEAMALAVLGFLGGYLAPVLISTGSGNHVALFSYYAVLNVAVLAISWKRNWRLLNLIGFAFTFGVGTAWGGRYYRPEMFASVEAFLVLFFLFYVLIGMLYVVRQTEHRRPWLDGTLVFGTPLVAFPLQAVLLRDNPMALAFSALAVAGIYAGLVYWLRVRRQEKLLTEAYAALAVGFATLAVPLAFSAGTTASLWALEGVGVAWIGLRQGRTLPRIAGLLLQLLAAGSYLISVFDGPGYYDAPLLLNATWLGAAILSFSGFALALLHDRHRPGRVLPALLMAWAAAWWMAAGASQWDRAERGIGAWNFYAAYLATSLALAGFLRGFLAWPRLSWMVALVAVHGLLGVFVAHDDHGSALAPQALGGWALYFAAAFYALWAARHIGGRSHALAHGLLLWTLALAATVHIDEQGIVAEGWRYLAMVAPVAVITLGLWRRPAWFAWPRADAFAQSYAWLWFGPALLLLLVAWMIGLFLAGGAEPLPYLPLVNPLELGLIGIFALLLGVARQHLPLLAEQRLPWALAGFAFVSMATLRAVHHLHGENWGPGLLDSGFSQASLTVVWSLIGVSAWIVGSRRVNRPLWMAGALLMMVVLLKLFAVDRQYMGNIPGIVSFVAVGLLLVGVGYFAPQPPKRVEEKS